MVDPEESVSPRLLESFVEEVSERFAAGELDLVIYTSSTELTFLEKHQYVVEFDQTHSQVVERAA